MNKDKPSLVISFDRKDFLQSFIDNFFFGDLSLERKAHLFAGQGIQAVLKKNSIDIYLYPNDVYLRVYLRDTSWSRKDSKTKAFKSDTSVGTVTFVNGLVAISTTDTPIRPENLIVYSPDFSLEDQGQKKGGKYRCMSSDLLGEMSKKLTDTFRLN